MTAHPSFSIQHERGQSAIMVTMVLVVFIALMALVVDVGNAYAQRRAVQNAADAAALAATGELARGDATTNHQVLARAKLYAQQNGIDPSTVTARYFRFNPDTQQQTDLGAVADDGNTPPSNASGVTVSMDRTFSTYLAQIVGRYRMTASANSAGQVNKGVCTAGDGGTGLFPIAVDSGVFNNDRDLGHPTFNTTYRVWGDRAAPGNFHWVSWDQGAGHTSETVLVTNMHNTANSGRHSVGGEVYASTGVQNSSAVRAELNARVADTDPTRPGTVLLPVYDVVSGNGQNAVYHVIGFAWFRITSYDFSGHDKYVEGVFTTNNVSASEGGCLDYGTTTIQLRPPMDVSRNIEGRLAYQYLQVDQSGGGQTTYPVDVALVMDTSGSMDQTWGGGQSKVSTARTVLQQFIAKLRPTLGDHVGLVHFPKVTSTDGASGYEQFGSNYNLACGGRSNYRFRSEVLQDLTTDMRVVSTTVRSLAANGGTPIADAMSKGFQMVNGASHTDGHAKIVILASDGMTNVTSDERWTGYSGNNTSGMGGCNGVAESQAINVALQAKMAGVTVFTVAIGDDFSSSILQAMASPNSDPSKPHFFTASNPTAMEQIYQSLGDRMVSFGGECHITPIEKAADGATVAIYDSGGHLVQTTTASASGSFIFRNVNPGVYTFAASLVREGLAYNVFTNRIGGYQISAPTITVDDAEGTYSADLSLKTATPPACGG
jgi:Flp pilus assembly protein TadG